jgi:hypothetical protein
MLYAAYGLAGLLAAAIVFLGRWYVVRPWAMTDAKRSTSSIQEDGL